LIGIVNYNIGNIGSVSNILNKLGLNSIIINSVDDFKKINTLILPGVGSFDYGISNLKELDFINPLRKHAIIDKKLTIGICLGMQLLMSSSEEGKEKGLNFIDGEVLKFKFSNNIKVPHMGWNYVESDDLLFSNKFNEKRFYFVHSYYVPINNFTLSKTTYGNIKFSSSIKKDNIYGFQFHPEKSHKYGMEMLSKILKNNEGI